MMFYKYHCQHDPQFPAKGQSLLIIHTHCLKIINIFKRDVTCPLYPSYFNHFSILIAYKCKALWQIQLDLIWFVEYSRFKSYLQVTPSSIHLDNRHQFSHLYCNPTTSTWYIHPNIKIFLFLIFYAHCQQYSTLLTKSKHHSGHKHFII